MMNSTVRSDFFQNRSSICLSKQPHPAILLETSHSDSLIPGNLHIHLPRPIHILHHPARHNTLLHHAPLLPHPASTPPIPATERSLPAIRATTRATNQDPTRARTVQGFLPEHAR